MGVRSPNPATGPPAQDSSARKISPHNFWLQKTSRDLVGGRNFWSLKQFLLKNLHMDLIRLIPPELQHWGSSLNGSGI